MFLLPILATLAVASTIYLLRQFRERSLDDVDAATGSPGVESEPAREALKAA